MSANKIRPEAIKRLYYNWREAESELEIAKLKIKELEDELVDLKIRLSCWESMDGN